MKKLEIRKFTPEGSNLFASLIQNKPLNIIEEVNNLVVSESHTIRLDKAIEIVQVFINFFTHEAMYNSMI